MYGGKGTKLGASKNSWLAFLKAYSEEVPRGNLTYREFVSQASRAYKSPQPMKRKPTERKHAPQESKYDAPAKRARVRRSQNLQLPTIAQMRAELGRMGATIPKAKKAPMYLALQTAYRGSTPVLAQRKQRVRSQNLKLPSIAEMKAYLKSQGIKGYSKLSKAELFALVKRQAPVGPVASAPAKRQRGRSTNLNIPTIAQLRKLLREQGHSVDELKQLTRRDLYDLYQLYFNTDNMGDFGEENYDYEPLEDFAFRF